MVNGEGAEIVQSRVEQPRRRIPSLRDIGRIIRDRLSGRNNRQQQNIKAGSPLDQLMESTKSWPITLRDAENTRAGISSHILGADERAINGYNARTLANFIAAEFIVNTNKVAHPTGPRAQANAQQQLDLLSQTRAQEGDFNAKADYFTARAQEYSTMELDLDPEKSRIKVETSVRGLTAAAARCRALAATPDNNLRAKLTPPIQEGAPYTLTYINAA